MNILINNLKIKKSILIKKLIKGIFHPKIKKEKKKMKKEHKELLLSKATFCNIYFMLFSCNTIMALHDFGG